MNQWLAGRPFFNIGAKARKSKFTVIQSGERLALDCLFLIEFDENGKCSVFREWWHLRAQDRLSGSSPDVSGARLS